MADLCGHKNVDSTWCTHQVDVTTPACAAGHPNRRFQPATPDTAAAATSASSGPVADVDDLVAGVAAPPLTAKVIRGNPGDRRRIPIGTLHVPARVTVTEYYEVAAWYSDVELQPGDYDVTTNGYWVFASIPGKTVSKHTPSLFAGVAIPSGEPQGAGHPDVGRATTFSLQHYAYQVAERIGSWAPVPGSSFEPAAGVEAVSHPFDTPDGRTVTIWDLVLTEEPPAISGSVSSS
jgi:hypothetical protein